MGHQADSLDAVAGAAAMSDLSICLVCGYETTFAHDHKPDNSGLDDGPDLYPARKKTAPKPPEIMAEIRARAWATRRAKYGESGHA